MSIRTVIAAAALATPLALPAAGPARSPDPAEDRAQAELMQLERDIGKANVERDAAFFERVEADEFLFTDSGGGLTTKAEDVDGVRKPPNPDVKLLAYDVDEMRVRVYGDAAVVTGRVTTRQLVKGEERTGRSRFTDVFVRREGRWQIVAGHSSRIKP
jgi:ketosteroid isomerase-like protein